MKIGLMKSVFLLIVILLSVSFISIAFSSAAIAEEDSTVKSDIIQVRAYAESNSADGTGQPPALVSVIISFEEAPEAREAVRATIEGLGGRVKRFYRLTPEASAEIPYGSLNMLSGNTFIIRVWPDMAVKADLANSVKTIMVNRTRYTPVNDFRFNGSGVGVCVLDTGMDYAHPDFGNCSLLNVTSGNCPKVPWGHNYVNTSRSGDPMDDNGHGTHVAGIVGANGSASGITGVAPEVKIIPMKILDEDGGGLSSDIKSAIEDCTINATKHNISVITMSLGSGSYSSYCDSVSGWTSVAASVNAAVNASIMVIAATGNSGSTTSIGGPACITNVTAVGDTNNGITITYNRNSLTDLLAPGIAINSTVPMAGSCTGSAEDENCDNSHYLQLSGTSQAAPHVAGVAALLVQAKRIFNVSGGSVNVSELEMIMRDTGDPISDAGGSGLTFKRVNAWGAVNYFDSTPPANPSVSASVSEAGAVTLNWSASSYSGSYAKEIANYTIYRSTDPEAGPTAYNSSFSAGNTTAYTDNSTSSGTRYYYAVCAYDFRGNQNTTAYDSRNRVNALADDQVAPTVSVRLLGAGTDAVTAATGSSNFYVNASVTDLYISTVKYRAVNESNASQVLIGWTVLTLNGTGGYTSPVIRGVSLPVSNWTFQINATDTAGNQNTTENATIESVFAFEVTNAAAYGNSTTGSTKTMNMTVEAKRYSRLLGFTNITNRGTATPDFVVYGHNAYMAVSGNSTKHQVSGRGDYSGSETMILPAMSLPSGFSSGTNAFTGVYAANVSFNIVLYSGLAQATYQGSWGIGLSDG